MKWGQLLRMKIVHELLTGTVHLGSAQQGKAQVLGDTNDLEKIGKLLIGDAWSVVSVWNNMNTTAPLARPTSISSSIACSPSEVPSNQVKVGNASHLRTNSFISDILGKEPESAERIRLPSWSWLESNQSYSSHREDPSSSGITPSLSAQKARKAVSSGYCRKAWRHRGRKDVARWHCPWESGA